MVEDEWTYVWADLDTKKSIKDWRTHFPVTSSGRRNEDDFDALNVSTDPLEEAKHFSKSFKSLFFPGHASLFADGKEVM